VKSTKSEIMVDPVSRSIISPQLRTQATGVSAGIAALKGNQQATRAIIEQLQKGLEQGKVLANENSGKSISQSGSSLPRGSLIDITV